MKIIEMKLLARQIEGQNEEEWVTRVNPITVTKLLKFIIRISA